MNPNTNRMRASHPDVYIRNHTQVLAVASTHFTEKILDYKPEFVDFVVPEELKQWASVNIGLTGGRPTSLLLFGQTKAW
jgi:hypothetical protein